MSHIDTLEVYKDYLKAGYTDKEADCAVHALSDAFDGIDSVKKAELDYILLSIKTDFDLLRKDFAGLRWIVIGMGGLFAVPIIQSMIIFFRG
jgi:hypothetical protein